jgi:hypothetical protein
MPTLFSPLLLCGPTIVQFISTITTAPIILQHLFSPFGLLSIQNSTNSQTNINKTTTINKRQKIATHI